MINWTGEKEYEKIDFALGLSFFGGLDKWCKAVKVILEDEMYYTEWFHFVFQLPNILL